MKNILIQKVKLILYIALTDMYDTNTIWVEKMPRLEEYLPVTLKQGEGICFNGNICSHINKINKTGKHTC